MRVSADRFSRRAHEADSSVAGIDLVIADHSVPLVELLGDHLDRLGVCTEGLSDPQRAIALARSRSHNPPDMVLVDLVFPQAVLNGLDIMMAFKKWCPESRLIVYTAARSQEALLFRVAWESISPASAVSKLSPVSTLIGTMSRVTELGRAEVDPLLQALLPHQRSPWRTADGYRRLAPHAGHAKLWKTLLDHRTPPPYKVIADESNLSVNTIRNYRDDLLAELRLHGLDNPTMQEMHEFVHSIRPLLAPILDERLKVESQSRLALVDDIAAAPNSFRPPTVAPVDEKQSPTPKEG